MKEKHAKLDIKNVWLDLENPRIKNALGKYEGEITPDHIYFALRSASENGTERGMKSGAGGNSSYQNLEHSIRANGKIIEPIRVVNRDGKYICIDGNTRLAIYRKFHKDSGDDKWSCIESIIMDNASDREIDAIRICAHLVGARQWPAYEKAQYLHQLRNKYLMDYDEIIALCGGGKADLERQIDAYSDMNDYYRDIVDDGAFNINRFSGFVELQRSKIKEAIFEAGLDLTNFGEWIRDGKIDRLADVRQLPRVLENEDAKKIFLDGGAKSIEKAEQFLNQQQPGMQPADKTALKDATLYQLAKLLTQKIDNLPYAEMQNLRDKNDKEVTEQVNALETLSAQLQKLLTDVTE